MAINNYQFFRIYRRNSERTKNPNISENIDRDKQLFDLFLFLENPCLLPDLLWEMI